MPSFCCQCLRKGRDCVQFSERGTSYQGKPSPLWKPACGYFFTQPTYTSMEKQRLRTDSDHTVKKWLLHDLRGAIQNSLISGSKTRKMPNSPPFQTAHGYDIHKDISEMPTAAPDKPEVSSGPTSRLVLFCFLISFICSALAFFETMSCYVAQGGLKLKAILLP